MDHICSGNSVKMVKLPGESWKTPQYAPCTHPATTFQFNAFGTRIRWLCGIHARHRGGKFSDVTLADLELHEVIELERVLLSHIDGLQQEIDNLRHAKDEARERLATVRGALK